MDLQIVQQDSVTIVTITGPSLDASNNREFVETFSPLMIPEARIIFNMCHLRFVDSSGLGSMMLCLRRLGASGGMLKLCGLSKSVQALFELVRMNRVFDIYRTSEEAVQALKSNQG
jgi:anti-sigma B factor antagonist